MMLDPFSHFRRQRQLASLAEDFVVRCRADLADRVRPRGLEMSPDEARGYLRAHARTLASERLRQARDRRLVAEHLAGPELLERIVEGLTIAVERELAKARVARDPLRKAA